MVGALILAFFLYLLSWPILIVMKQKNPKFQLGLMKALFWWHILFGVIYYITVMNARSDSYGYYNRPLYEHTSWMSVYTTGTRFIDWLAYPLVNFFKFSYEMTMIFFTWIGYWGFVFFYIFFQENIENKHQVFKRIHYGERSFGMSLITLFMFLPNMHYWTASLGKGSVIFTGLGLTIYGLSRLSTRKLALIFGMTIIYHVRPHVFLFMGVAILVGLFTGRQKVPFYQKLLVFMAAGLVLAVMYNQIMSFVGLDTENLQGSFDQFSSKRAKELANSNSGIDISNYPLVFKLFTFWFRPLFIDAPGPIGIIVSFENLIYLYFALQLFQKGFIRFIATSSALVKTSAVVFLATSFAMAETLSNMGIIVRQKSMVMYFFMFVIISFMDYKKSQKLEKSKKMNNTDLEPLKSIQPA